MSTFAKYDDASWHEGDAANRVQAGLHIAFVYFWLVTRKYLHDPELDGEILAKIENEEGTPGEFFDEWHDGKLTSEGVTPDVVRFLGDFYSSQYLIKVSKHKIPQLQYDDRFSQPYNFRNSWQNVTAVSEYLDNAYERWSKKKNGHRFRIFGR